MKNLHLENSYKIWQTDEMRTMICRKAHEVYDCFIPTKLLNRSYLSMYVEWWLHNIGYYVTLPFSFIECIKKINLRCKDVDINERR